jgi:hypothetical protein
VLHFIIESSVKNKIQNPMLRIRNLRLLKDESMRSGESVNENCL